MEHASKADAASELINGITPKVQKKKKKAIEKKN